MTAPDAGGGAAFVEAVDALWRWSVLAGAAPAKSDDAAFRKAETARAALLAAHADAAAGGDADAEAQQ